MRRADGGQAALYSEAGTISRFTLVGIVATLTHYGVAFAAALLLGLQLQASNAAGFTAAVGVSYALHRSFTFRSRSAVRETLPRFLLTAGSGYAVSALILALLKGAGHDGLAALAIAPLAITVFNYLASRFWVFLR